MFKGQRTTSELRYLFKISHWLCIQPEVNLQNLKHPRSAWNTSYRIIIFVIMVSSTIYTFFGRIFSTTYDEYTLILTVVDSLQQLALFVFNIYCMLSSMLSCKCNFYNAISKLKELEKGIPHKNKTWNVVVKEIVFFNTLYLLLALMEWVSWSFLIGVEYIALFAFEKVEAYLIMVQVLVMANFVRTIQQCFNTLAEDLIKFPRCLQNIQQSNQKFILMIQLVDYFNSYFGFGYLCFYLILLTSFLSTFSYGFFYNNNTGTLVNCATWFCVFLVSSFYV